MEDCTRLIYISYKIITIGNDDNKNICPTYIVKHKFEAQWQNLLWFVKKAFLRIGSEKWLVLTHIIFYINFFIKYKGNSVKYYFVNVAIIDFDCFEGDVILCLITINDPLFV